MELVGALSEIVGFRSVEPGAGTNEDAPADPVSYLTDRRDARLEELRVAAERWLDDGGSFDTEAAAAALEPPPSWTER
jgi:hypothetical protein